MDIAGDVSAMSDKDRLDQLRFRRDRINELMTLQKKHLVLELLKAELFYVEAMIEYRERHGNMEGVILQ